MLIAVLQGERERAGDNWSWAASRIQFEPAPRGGAAGSVQFEIDANGILHVLPRHNERKIVEMKSASMWTTRPCSKWWKSRSSTRFETSRPGACRIPLASISNLNAYPRHPARGRLELNREAAQAPVVASSLALALQHGDEQSPADCLPPW